MSKSSLLFLVPLVGCVSAPADSEPDPEPDAEVLVSNGAGKHIHTLEVDGLTQVTVGSVTDADARLAGFASREEMIEFMKPVAKTKLTASTQVFRGELHHAGDGDRVTLALEDQLSP